MAGARNFREYSVWNKAVDYATYVYEVTGQMPWFEKKGLCDQLQRAVVSISSNIAEGAARSSDADFAHFLDFRDFFCRHDRLHHSLNRLGFQVRVQHRVCKSPHGLAYISNSLFRVRLIPNARYKLYNKVDGSDQYDEKFHKSASDLIILSQ